MYIKYNLAHQLHKSKIKKHLNYYVFRDFIQYFSIENELLVHHMTNEFSLCNTYSKL